MIDLLVAGGGPAGLATAVRATQAGLEAVVVERRSGPIDKACGEGLMPHGVRQLEALGAQPRGWPLRGISYVDGHRRAAARFGSGVGRGIRRTTLHAALLDTARAAGVQIVHGEVGEITQDTDGVRAGGLRARYLVAADGLHSPVRRSLGLERDGGAGRRWGIRRHYQVAPWSDGVEVHWAAGAEAYITPVSDDLVGVTILTSQRGRFDQQFEQFPELRDRVGAAEHSRDRAAGPLRQRVRSRRAGRVLLVGDAAGYVDAMTGEGVGLAFVGAQVLVDCVAAGRVDDYDRQWRRVTRRYRLLTVALLRASSYRPVRSCVVPAATALPGVFTHVIGLIGE